jgi:omega-6 fatty acid desaturase (delta-12 desaturase)
LWDALVIWCFYKATTYLDPLIDTSNFFLYTFLKVALWSLYGFWTGLFATGLWVIGHECGHQSFSESKTINNTVGWIVHSSCVFIFSQNFFWGKLADM